MANLLIIAPKVKAGGDDWAGTPRRWGTSEGAASLKIKDDRAAGIGVYMRVGAEAWLLCTAINSATRKKQILFLPYGSGNCNGIVFSFCPVAAKPISS